MGPLIKVIFLCLFGGGPWAWAHEAAQGHGHSHGQVEEGSWALSTQLVFEGRVFQKPSSLLGSSQFSIPTLSLQAEYFEEEGFELVLEWLAKSPGNEMPWHQASVFVPGESTTLRVGLGISDLDQRRRRFEPYERVFAELAPPLERWGYQPKSDYGLEWMSGEGGPWKWSLMVTNGEGAGQPDQGPQKDFQATLMHEQGETRGHLIYFQARRGGYENIPTPKSPKVRASVGWLIAPMDQGFYGGFEAFYAEDPVDAINEKVAAEVELTDLGGERVIARGLTAKMHYRWLSASGRSWEIFYRGDDLEPVRGDRRRSIISQSFGLAWSQSRRFQWFVANSHLIPSEGHASVSKEEQSWRIALNVQLDD